MCVDFNVVLIDPPWPERGSGKSKRGADRHYSLITKKEEILRVILQAPVWSPADPSHMYMWTTNTYLPWALWLMEALGYRYTTNICWVKTRKTFSGTNLDYMLQLVVQGKTLEAARAVQRYGLGQWFRGGHELLLFGTRGTGFTSLRTDRRDLPGTIIAPRSEHSAKPVEFHELIEARSKGPYLEMFARQTRPGWSCWGDETPLIKECEDD